MISVLESTPSLINTTDDEKRTALHWAVDRDNLEATKRLIQLGSDINLQDIDGCTVLERISFTLIQIRVRNQDRNRAFRRDFEPGSKSCF